MTAMSILFVTWIFDVAERDRYQQHVRTRVTESLTSIRLRLEQSIHQRLSLAQAIASYFNVMDYQVSADEFKQFIDHLLTKENEVSQIRLYRDQRITHAYPLPLPELSRSETDTIEQALQQQALWVAGPTEDERQAHFILFLPIFSPPTADRPAQIWGMLSMFIPRQHLLSEAGIEILAGHPLSELYSPSTHANKLVYTLVGRHGQGPAGGVFFGRPDLFLKAPIVLTVTLPSGTWRLAGLPAQGWPHAAPVSLWLWAIGLTLALFGALLVFTLFNAPRQLRYAIKQATQKIVELNNAYERFVPNGFLNLLGKESVLTTSLGDQTEREMTVLFSDIRGFTSISEQLSTRENFDYVNHYLGQMEPIIVKHQGLIDKYIGDAIMVLFPTNADDALSCAVDMLKALEQYNILLTAIAYPSIHVGIGLNSGSLMLGIIGGQTRMDSTVIGDTVNLSARIEALTKTYGVPLLITEHTYQRLQDPSQYRIRMVDRVTVKGKSTEVTVYEVYDADPSELKLLKQKTQHIFDQAMSCFQREEFPQALYFFEQVVTTNPEDTVANIYVQETRKILSLTQQQTPMVLVVDDVDINLTVMYEMLSHNGFEVLIADSGEGALETLNYAQPHIILLDVMMPNMDGFEVCRRIKADPKTAHIPIIFTTALSEVENKLKGFKAGAVDYITKPFQSEEVLARVRSHLTIYQLQQRLLATDNELHVQNQALKKRIAMLAKSV